MRLKMGVVCVLAGLASLPSWGFAQAGNLASRWLPADDPTAKWMIEMERKWAESACDHNGVERTLLAEDFHGVAPDGSEYDKKQAIENAGDTKTTARECKLLGVKVHLFGDSVAVLYGSETAIYPAAAMPDHKEHTVKLTWVDTWLKRDGKWQVIAAEDMPSEAK